MAPRTLGRAAKALLAPRRRSAPPSASPPPPPRRPSGSASSTGNTSLNGYTLYNNIWGSGAGSQCIWANSGTNWGVWANDPEYWAASVSSYPSKEGDQQVDHLARLAHQRLQRHRPSSGAYNTSYDIWDTGYKYEVMLWVNKTGAVGPLGTSQGTLTLGGHTWTVYKGNNGSNDVFSFVRTSNSSSGTVGRPADPQVDQEHQGLSSAT